MKTQSYLFHFVLLLYSYSIFLLLKKCFQRPSINAITHFLRFLTPPSPLLVANFTKQAYEVTSPQLLADPSQGPPPKSVTSFMDGRVALPKLSVKYFDHNVCFSFTLGTLWKIFSSTNSEIESSGQQQIISWRDSREL